MTKSSAGLMHRSKAKAPSQPQLYTTEVQHDITLPATLLCLTKLLLYVVVMQYDVMHHDMFEWL